MQGLEGKTAIVTGGSSGIGQAIAVRLGHEGVNVAVNYVGPPGRRTDDEGRHRTRRRDVHVAAARLRRARRLLVGGRRL